jgi:hypothetical protein
MPGFSLTTNSDIEIKVVPGKKSRSSDSGDSTEFTAAKMTNFFASSLTGIKA